MTNLETVQQKYPDAIIFLEYDDYFEVPETNEKFHKDHLETNIKKHVKAGKKVAILKV